ncbi:hypothetical protein K504DRAFT_489645 [Pleomassaria siparia CBS 279.74]|uniref:DUF7924 domain-containing protein n=1 Tax=Pleomassaria siparia CBS 279.74 TaxID=1314801 RepID=A0A6G1KG26_9PLEO|nr:hypothetical protein K504DRAFT_489645 [Pleomassaria siparia CBS 279.74]
MTLEQFGVRVKPPCWFYPNTDGASQAGWLRGLFELFRLVGREGELYNTINGFSFSHSGVDVRIWAHLIVPIGNNPRFYREPIASFNIEKTAQADNRWTGWTVAMNILHLWVPDHFKLICSAIDMLPAGLSFELSEPSVLQSPDEDLVSSRSGLSQQLEEYNLADNGIIPDAQPSAQQITPATSTQTKVQQH